MKVVNNKPIKTLKTTKAFNTCPCALFIIIVKQIGKEIAYIQTEKCMPCFWMAVIEFYGAIHDN